MVFCFLSEDSNFGSFLKILDNVVFVQRALKLIDTYRQYTVGGPDIYYEFDIEKARILKACGETEAARSLLDAIVMKTSGNLKSLENWRLTSEAHKLLAEFDIEACRPDLAEVHFLKV